LARYTSHTIWLYFGGKQLADGTGGPPAALGSIGAMGVGVLPFFLFWVYMANYLFNMFYKYCKVLEGI
jgi:hypothetical protein